MKNRLFIIVTLLCCSFVNSCCGPEKTQDRMSYCLSFVFTDSEGNNLSKGINLKDWIPSGSPSEEAVIGTVADYKLDIILGKQSDLFDNKVYRIINPKDKIAGVTIPVEPLTLDLLYIREEGGCLGNEFVLGSAYCDQQEKLTYEIICPHVFGNDEKHIVTTYWKRLTDANLFGSTYYAECYKVEFEGQEIVNIEHNDIAAKDTYLSNVVTLVVNR